MAVMEREECPSQRKVSKVLFLEFFSKEGFTRFHSLCFSSLFIFELEEEQDRSQMWPLESPSIVFSVLFICWYMNKCTNIYQLI